MRTLTGILEEFCGFFLNKTIHCDCKNYDRWIMSS